MSAEAQLKRSKHCPQRISSKKAVSTLRVAPGLVNGTAKPKGRDPRFDAISKGSFDETRFRQQYAHVFEQQREEVKEIKAVLSSSRKAEKASQKGSVSKKRRVKSRILAPEVQDELKEELNQKSNKLQEHEQALAKQKAKSLARQKEVKAIGEGKRPFFQKQSDVKKTQLVAKYDELKQAGRLDKFMTKKRQKTASKQRRLLPSQRAGEGE
eukprot:CAMPEP_0183351710 /NCGR_PEP_ID=MMETSP0164_2-20130417/26203_1 /TAXON_ID=221442 /ORGANISM="Coccolithus pelagicus ssp braarudi, Strain PLY182g" /LENGTH=210 /DNA_ID=CAMNT_0025523961 /DNA_START=12 /DNA_END=644 /DNA_ORIENTATION=+